MLLRRLVLSGDHVDPNWTDPSVEVPDNARAFVATASRVVFDVIGKASGDPGAAEADVGAMLVDAWVGYEGGLRDPADPAAGKTIRRGLSVVEESGQALSARIRIVATDVVEGSTCHLNLALTVVGALPAVDVILVAGGRPL